MTRRPITSVALALSMAWFPTALAAQYRTGLRVGISVPAVPVDSAGILTARIESKTYWKVGFIAGTTIGTLLILPFAGWDGDSITPSDVLIAAVGGSLIGGVPGALIGGLFPKGEKRDSKTAH